MDREHGVCHPALPARFLGHPLAMNQQIQPSPSPSRKAPSRADNHRAGGDVLGDVLGHALLQGLTRLINEAGDGLETARHIGQCMAKNCMNRPVNDDNDDGQTLTATGIAAELNQILTQAGLGKVSVTPTEHQFSLQVVDYPMAAGGSGQSELAVWALLEGLLSAAMHSLTGIDDLAVQLASPPAQAGAPLDFVYCGSD